MLQQLSTIYGEDLPGTPWNVYPRPQMRRDNWLNLNGEWAFSTNYGEPEGVKTILVPFCPESKLSGVEHKDFMLGVWYQKKIRLTEEQCAGRIFLHFGAVDYECYTYVNGQLAGSHKGGYISCRKAKSPLGPIRKYYSITDEGIVALNDFKQRYSEITRLAQKILYN